MLWPAHHPTHTLVVQPPTTSPTAQSFSSSEVPASVSKVAATGTASSPSGSLESSHFASVGANISSPVPSKSASTTPTPGKAPVAAIMSPTGITPSPSVTTASPASGTLKPSVPVSDRPSGTAIQSASAPKTPSMERRASNKPSGSAPSGWSREDWSNEFYDSLLANKTPFVTPPYSECSVRLQDLIEVVVAPLQSLHMSGFMSSIPLDRVSGVPASPATLSEETAQHVLADFQRPHTVVNRCLQNLFAHLYIY